LALALLSPSKALALSPGYVVQQGVNAGLIAALYCLLAIAYSLIHAVVNRIVLSFGDIAMFGAFAAVYGTLWGLVGGTGVVSGLLAAFIFSLAATAALSHLAQSHVFTPLIRTPSQAIMIASIGLSIVVQETMRIQSGGREQWLPPFFSKYTLTIPAGGFPVVITGIQFIALTLALVQIVGLLLVLRGTKAGRFWRACSQNLELARLCGVDTQRAITITALAAALYASAAGFILAVSYGGVSFYMGLVLGLKALFASIIGGFGTIGGAIAGGIALAILETAWSAFFPIVYRDVAVFLIVVILLVLKPDGLLGYTMRRDSEV
jgi:branched-chain amino acid transport system permease protein